MNKAYTGGILPGTDVTDMDLGQGVPVLDELGLPTTDITMYRTVVYSPDGNPVSAEIYVDNDNRVVPPPSGA